MTRISLTAIACEAAVSWWQNPTSSWPVREWGAPAELVDGPQGMCWHNARRLAGTDPSRLAYAEGVAWGPAPAWPSGPQLHGWVVDRRKGSVVEPTGSAADAVCYRGMTFDSHAVERFLDTKGRRARWTELRAGHRRSRPPAVTVILFAELAEVLGEADTVDPVRPAARYATSFATGWAAQRAAFNGTLAALTGRPDRFRRERPPTRST